MTIPPPPRPFTDTASARVLDRAIGSLGTLRDLEWIGDARATIHILTSLIRQAEQLLPDAITEARNQQHTWTDIARALGTTIAEAREHQTATER